MSSRMPGTRPAGPGTIRGRWPLHPTMTESPRMHRPSATAAFVLILLAAPAAVTRPPWPIPRRSPATGRAR